jgi:hypothetical protein
MTDTHLLDDLDASTPIGACLTAWHRLFQGDRDALGRVLAEEVVLHSPVLFAPIQGKQMVSLYLTGAAMTFVEASDAGSAPQPRPQTSHHEWDGTFRYVRVLTGERDAVLEFETTMAGKYVNGVDMITCDDAGMIVDFKVMVRPLKAVEAVREMMAAALEQLQS